jgi:hypothetical protein
MVIDMNTTRLETIGQVRAFLAGVCDVELRALSDDDERRRFVERTLRWFGYSQRLPVVSAGCCSPICSGSRATRVRT